VLFVLGELSDEGHVYCPLQALVDQASRVLEIDLQIIEQAISTLVELGSLRAEELEDADQGPAVFLAALHAAESGAAARLRAILAAETRPIDVELDRAVTGYEKQQAIQLAEQQREAIRRATDCKALVITGGPGTGKTTIVNGILRILREAGRRILLCAPTGRAAKRLHETTGQQAKTIHRLLEFNPRRHRFERGEDNPLEADLLVVDEVSMVDTLLLHALLRAVPEHCQLILVGDVDQLPSVGPGSVLQDLIRSGVLHVVRLTEIFRQAQQSLIVLNAHRVNQGLSLVAKDEADFYFIERQEPEDVLSTIKELVARRIPRRFALDSKRQVQVITPMHRGILGSRNLNTELQALLNPGGESLVRGSRVYRVGDKVMQLRNNYDLDVYNGDIGQIERIDEDERQLELRVDDRRVVYDLSDIDELSLAYACSVHKAQGSEFEAVVMPLHTQHYPMLQRNLLYTAITRGRRLVVIVGSKKALAIAVNNDRVRQRYTRLAERLTGCIQGPA
jgi:exodeoxyribonuclease V alpha subunit